MSRPAKKGPAQPGLFDLVDQVQRARSLPDLLKKALADDLAQSPYPRDQVGSRMTVLLETLITVAMLDAWTAATKQQHRFPLQYLPAFQQATGQSGAVRLVVEFCGGRLVMPGEMRRELAQVEDQRRQLGDRERVLRALVAADEKGELR